ncbi:MAG: VOC family protein [Anaerolineaceae bacterium]|nr:VOC family protein [Anaerolineaceae bacterium]
MSILSIHHITTVSSNMQRTVDFYTGTLGLHLVKKTVSFKPPHHYHVYFGDETGRPSTLVTVLEQPGVAHGHPGIGGTHHFAFIVETPEAQLKWKRRLTDAGQSVIGPYNRVYFRSIYFHDPDGTILEIATRQPGFAVDEPVETLGQAFCPPPFECMDGHRDEAAIQELTWPDPVPAITADMRLTGIHHITAIGSDIQRTSEFYTRLLDLPLVKRTANFDDPKSPHYYYALRLGDPGSIITYFERDPVRQGPVQPGAGQTHHFALSVASPAELPAWRERLLSAGQIVSDVKDYKYYQAIQFKDPFGHTLEIASASPSFNIDEETAELGAHLMLPQHLEHERQYIEAQLLPLSVPLRVA